MTDIVERLQFDSARCEAQFSKGVSTNIDEAVAEIENLRRRVAALELIILEDLHPDDCSDDLNHMLVADIHARHQS